MNQKQISIPIKGRYDPKSKNIIVEITPLVAVMIPFDIYQNIYYEAKKARQKPDIITPQKKILLPSDA